MKTFDEAKSVGRSNELGYDHDLHGCRQMDVEKRITEAFQEFSERSTQPRQIIARSLIRLGKSGAVFSAEDLIRQLHKSNPHLGRATVYRSMERLVRMKVLDRIDFADGSHFFRLCGTDHHHHHLACTNCHSVVDLDFCLAKEQIAAIGRKERFSIQDHAITLFGLCENCRDGSGKD